MKNKILLSLFFLSFIFLSSDSCYSSAPIDNPSILSDVKEISGAYPNAIAMLAYLICWGQGNDLKAYLNNPDNHGWNYLFACDVLSSILRGKDVHIWTWLYAPRNYSFLQAILKGQIPGESWDWDSREVEGRKTEKFNLSKFIACNANTIAMILYTVCWSINNNLRQYAKENNLDIATLIIATVISIFNKKDTIVPLWLRVPRNYGIFQKI